MFTTIILGHSVIHRTMRGTYKRTGDTWTRGSHAPQASPRSSETAAGRGVCLGVGLLLLSSVVTPQTSSFSSVDLEADRVVHVLLEPADIACKTRPQSYS